MSSFSALSERERSAGAAVVRCVERTVLAYCSRFHSANLLEWSRSAIVRDVDTIGTMVGLTVCVACIRSYQRAQGARLARELDDLLQHVGSERCNIFHFVGAARKTFG